jgi:UMF1 family MFS transporter
MKGDRMTATMPLDSAPNAYANVDEKTYKRRVFAWTMYDWANSAFATTILAAVLPVYFSLVAAATLPSDAQATAYWSLGLSLSLLIGAIISPILGTISDISRSKKRFLAIFTMIGVIPTALLILVTRGDWILASVLFIIARVGFIGSITFYDSFLPHVARSEDQDSVSARGYAMGYLGGGLLLAINVVMLQLLPGTWGARLSFLSVAIWWAVFSIPIFRRVPEPPAAGALQKGETVVRASLRQLSSTFGDLRRYRELFKYLIAFLIYNDAIGTIIGVAVIYGAELGFGSVELILALLLVQFVGIPFSLMFGRLPSPLSTRRAFYLAFVCFNIVALPLVGIAGSQLLASNVSGAEPAPYLGSSIYGGQGVYPVLLGTERPDLYSINVQGSSDELLGSWTLETVSEAQSGAGDDVSYAVSVDQGDELVLTFQGQTVIVTYSLAEDHGAWSALIDGVPVMDVETGEPLLVDTYSDTPRFGETLEISAETAGEHVLTIINAGALNPVSTGNMIGIASLEVLPPARTSNLLFIIGGILLVQLIGVVFAWLLGKPLFGRMASTLDTRRTILLSLVVYSVIAIWGFFVNSTIEFWFLAWMVAIVQGGSQALSRSLFASMSPKSKSGEFFGLYGVMEKFSSIIGPLLFAAAVAIFGSSRPAIISLIVFFIIGGYLLTRVNVAEGQRVAQAEDAAL